MLLIRRKHNDKKILIINTLPNNGFKFFIISIFLFIINCVCIRFDHPGTIAPKNINLNLKRKKVSSKIIDFFTLLKINLKKIPTLIQTFSISLIGRKNLYILTGNSRFRSAKKIYPFSRLIFGNSYDANNSLLNKKYNRLKRNIKERYCLYIDSVVPLIKSDEIFLKNKKQPVKKGMWYKQLNKFFNIIEEQLDLKVIIAGHPKTRGFNLQKYFKKRKIFYDQTEALVKFSDFIITRNSAAFSYGIIHQKPIICILNKEFMADKNFMQVASGLWHELSLQPTRIDNEKSIYNSLKNLSFNKKVYKKFKYHYLLNNLDLTNQELIIEAFKKHI